MRSATHIAHVGLGSNLGDRERAIAEALRLLDLSPRVSVRAVSSMHETEAMVAPGGAPQDPYFNAAAEIETTREPLDLLHLMLDIERSLGREREQGTRWTPRTIDLDLLYFDDDIIDEPGIRVPHPGLHERRFVLAPLGEIAPNKAHPILGLTTQTLLEKCIGERAPHA